MKEKEQELVAVVATFDLDLGTDWIGLVLRGPTLTPVHSLLGWIQLSMPNVFIFSCYPIICCINLNSQLDLG